jgi:transposase
MYKAVEKSYFDSRIKRSDLFKYQHIKEEIDAWQRGLKLAKSLNIKIDKDEYDKYAAKCVKTYIQLYGTK